MILRRFMQHIKEQNWFAVGLDVLVVIVGIFLGMQVTEWNEERIKRHVELELLNTIESDIAQDIINLELMITGEEEMLAHNKELMNILRSDQEYHPSMNTHFGMINRYHIFYPQKFGYESLKTIGLDIIQSNELKAEIVRLYDYHYGVIAETLDVKKQLYLDTNAIFLAELETVKSPEGDTKVSYKQPNDFAALKQNVQFFNYLSHIYAERKNIITFSESALDVVKNVHNKLKLEIASKNNGTP